MAHVSEDGGMERIVHWNKDKEQRVWRWRRVEMLGHMLALFLLSLRGIALGLGPGPSEAKKRQPAGRREIKRVRLGAERREAWFLGNVL